MSEDEIKADDALEVQRRTDAGKLLASLRNPARVQAASRRNLAAANAALKARREEISAKQAAAQQARREREKATRPERDLTPKRPRGRPKKIV